MSQVIKASVVSRSYKLKAEPGKRVFVEVGKERVEMVWRECKGAAFGRVWYFLLPGRKQPCRSICLKDDKTVHRAKAMPGQYGDGVVGRFLEIQQKAREAREIMSRPRYRINYMGKPTKRHLRLLKDASRYIELTDHDLIYNLEGIAAVS